MAGAERRQHARRAQVCVCCALRVARACVCVCVCVCVWEVFAVRIVFSAEPPLAPALPSSNTHAHKNTPPLSLPAPSAAAAAAAACPSWDVSAAKYVELYNRIVDAA